MKRELEPHELHEGLRRDRLETVGRIFKRVRSEAIADYYKPSKGDTPWGLGCVCYERFREALRQAAEKNEWLAWIPTV